MIKWIWDTGPPPFRASLFHIESSLEHESYSKVICNFAFIDAFAIIIFKPLKITQFFHKFANR